METQGLLAVAIFSGESLLQELKSPWELFLTEPVPEEVEFRPADWAEKYFSAQSATKDNGVEIAYISYKNLRYTFDKFAEEIYGRVLVPSSHVKACSFLGFVEYLFSETFHDNLSVARAKQLSRSMKKRLRVRRRQSYPAKPHR